MDKDISIYVHIPFCKSKCQYCDFLSFGGEHIYSEEYKESLIKEIYGYSTDRRVKSIFIGGGTPSIMPKGYIASIMKAIYDKYDVLDNAEITLEANPGTICKEKVQEYKQCGINRISMGLQAWQNRLLNYLGRVHTVEEFVENYRLIRACGFENINIDLMFALPTQTLSEWLETLNNVIKLEPEHISCYSLIVEEGTPFYDKYEKGLLPAVDEDLDREMYHSGVDILSRNGYNQYEISNFAKPDRECRHNMVYWHRGDYIGFGLGSAGLVDGVRYNNTRNMEDYIRGITVEEKQALTYEDCMGEFMFLGLRCTDGIDTDVFSKCFGKDIFEVYGEAIQKHISNGLLELKNKNLRLTKRGIDLSNIVFIEFV